MMIDSSITLAFSVFENPGVFALLLGSGVSRASQIPTGWEIILDLSRRLGSLESVEEQEDWTAWYHERFGKEPNYSDLLDSLSRSPAERRSIIHNYIEPDSRDVEQGRKLPNRAHRAIAKLVHDGFIKVILTTNFDRLLENALRDEGVEPTVIRSDDDISGAVPLTHSRCYLVKVHGDYLDARIRNTEEELKGYSAPLNSLLDRVFDEHGLIVCGWSADWDHALRSAITRAPSRRYPMYWASKGGLSSTARDLISSRQGITVQIADAENFFEYLQRRVDAQKALKQTNPRSVALLVATAKKYMVKSEFRIQLHDLVTDETRRLRETLSEPGLGPNGPVNAEEFRERVARFEAASEPLARLFAVMGRWGGDEEFSLCSEILKLLGKQRALGGYTVFIKLMSYPAVLLLYAFGIGALRASRFKTLFDWFSVPIEKENIGELSTSVQSLFLWDWAGNDREDWCALEGLEKRATPLSDHLHTITKRLCADLAIDSESFELIFDRFELLSSLANATFVYSKEELKTFLGRERQFSARIPVGRLGWRQQGWRALENELAQPDFRAKLLAGGFCQSNDDHLTFALQNIERVIGRMGWW